MSLLSEMTSAVRAGHHFLKIDMVLDWELAIKKSHVQPAPCLQASVHASAGRPCMRSVFSGGCFMIFHTSMRNIHASNKNDIMMLLGLKMIYSIL